ncbi:hypothetical protein CUC44_05765 [Aeromonas lusitana]|uniref:Uncharacterized protein n=1 Tax=Aeromonas lusitana TaxID=931529 RepID=A0A2M8HCI5_9GAMM|nr:hypothetical protein CUC44_05765 [Aeromonas lusitana]
MAASVPGRLRIRQGAVDPAQLRHWQAELATWPEVQSTRLNPEARSLIVQYHVAQCEQAEMESRVLTLCNGPQDMQAHASRPSEAVTTQAPRPAKRAHRAAWRRRANRGAKIAAMVALPVSIALVYAGNKRLHAATGWLFVAALSVHLAIHRRNVFH